MFKYDANIQKYTTRYILLIRLIDVNIDGLSLVKPIGLFLK